MLLVLGARNGRRGDLVGDSSAGSIFGVKVLVAAFELIQERSSDAAAGVGVYSFVGEGEGDGRANVDGVACFSGEPVGVAARTVVGDRSSGDCGRRNGDMRALLSLRPKDSGAGLSGDGGLDCGKTR